MPDGNPSSSDEGLSTNERSRRRLLQAIGVGTSALALGSRTFGKAIAEEGSKVGQTQFVEVAVEHRTEAASEFPRTEIRHSDGFLDYFVEPEASRLVLGKFVGERAKTLFAERDVVAKALEYQAVPGTPSVERPDDSLVVDVGKDMSAARELRVEDAYSAPNVTVSSGRNGTVEVSVGDKRTEVASGHQWTEELASREVTVPRQTDSFEEVPDDRRGGSTKRRVYTTEELSVVPEVTVRNHGQLNVYEYEGGE